jgi:hypothetical protein
MFVCCECCVLLGRGLCDELTTCPEESYRLRCVVVCDLETSRMRRPWPALGRSSTARKKKPHTFSCVIMWARRFIYYSVNSVFFILYYLVLLHILAIFLYFWPSRRDAMSTRFPFVPHLSNFLTFPYYSLNTRFSFLVVFLRCSYSRAILRVRFFSPFFIFPLLQMVWRAWILARHLSFLRQPVNRVLYILVIVSKFYLIRRLRMSSLQLLMANPENRGQKSTSPMELELAYLRASPWSQQEII